MPQRARVVCMVCGRAALDLRKQESAYEALDSPERALLVAEPLDLPVRAMLAAIFEVEVALDVDISCAEPDDVRDDTEHHVCHVESKLETAVIGVCLLFGREHRCHYVLEELGPRVCPGLRSQNQYRLCRQACPLIRARAVERNRSNRDPRAHCRNVLLKLPVF